MPTYDFARYLNIRIAYAPSFAPRGDAIAFLTELSHGASRSTCFIRASAHAHSMSLKSARCSDSQRQAQLREWGYVREVDRRR